MTVIEKLVYPGFVPLFLRFIRYLANTERINIIERFDTISSLDLSQRNIRAIFPLAILALSMATIADSNTP
jgi:hypothetical protein